MAQELEYSTFYLDLDVLMDTRIGAWALAGDEQLQAVLNQDYLGRYTDRLPGCDYDRFRAIYDARDKSVLKHSVITAFGRILKDFVLKTVAQIQSTPFHYKPRICLNVYPYILTDDEINAFISGIITITEGLADVQVINHRPELITPGHVKNNYSIVAMYEYYKWIEYHSGSGLFSKTTCPEVTLLGPAMYVKPVPALPSDHLEVYEAIETLHRPLIGLKLISPVYFSMFLKKETTT
jgi:hypothetical protein